MTADKTLSDSFLQMKEGKEEGFNLLYSQTYNYVYARALYIMKNEQDALDLTQETYIQAYKGLSSLENPDSIYAWLGSITYRQGMRIFRERKELLLDEDSSCMFEELTSDDKDLQPEAAADTKATTEIIKGMIDELPELQRAAVIAFYYDNMKIDEIASVFECSSNTIKSRLNYAKKFLKDKVTEHERINRYKLCSLSPAVLLLAYKALLSGEKYTMQTGTAQNIYRASCSTLGLISTGAATVTAATGASAGVTGATTSAVAAASASTGVSAAATGIAAKVGLTLGAKFAIGIAAIGVAGAVSVGAATYSHNAKIAYEREHREEVTDESYSLQEDSTGTQSLQEVPAETETLQEDLAETEMVQDDPSESETLQTESFETVSFIREGEYLHRRDHRNPGSCKIIISNVTVSGDAPGISFDLCIENYDANEQIIDIVNTSVSELRSRNTVINATSSANNQWIAILNFLRDGSVRMFCGWDSPDGSSHTLTSDEELAPYTAIAASDSFRNDLKIEEGQYVYTYGEDISKDGGYMISIKNVQNSIRGQSFDMDLTFVNEQDNGVEMDSVFTEQLFSVYLTDNIASIICTSNLGNTIAGYLTVLEDGSIGLSYDTFLKKEIGVPWTGEYPEYTPEMIILQKQD